MCFLMRLKMHALNISAHVNVRILDQVCMLVDMGSEDPHWHESSNFGLGGKGCGIYGSCLVKSAQFRNVLKGHFA